MELIIFNILSALTLFFALMAVISKTPIYSLLYIIGCFFCVAGHYALLNAQFLAIVQVIVYAGAIMVLFLFTVMMMNLNKAEKQKTFLMKLAAVISSGSLLLLLVAAIRKTTLLSPTAISDPSLGMVKNLGKILLNEYMFPFEFISILLLSAMIGAVLLSKKEKVLS